MGCCDSREKEISPEKKYKKSEVNRSAAEVSLQKPNNDQATANQKAQSNQKQVDKSLMEDKENIEWEASMIDERSQSMTAEEGRRSLLDKTTPVKEKYKGQYDQQIKESSPAPFNPPDEKPIKESMEGELAGKNEQDLPGNEANIEPGEQNEGNNDQEGKEEVKDEKEVIEEKPSQESQNQQEPIQEAKADQNQELVAQNQEQNEDQNEKEEEIKEQKKERNEEDQKEQNEEEKVNEEKEEDPKLNEGPEKQENEDENPKNLEDQKETDSKVQVLDQEAEDDAKLEIANEEQKDQEQEEAPVMETTPPKKKETGEIDQEESKEEEYNMTTEKSGSRTPTQPTEDHNLTELILAGMRKLEDMGQQEIELALYLDQDRQIIQKGNLIGKDYSKIEGEISLEELKATITITDKDNVHQIEGQFSDREFSSFEGKFYENQSKENGTPITLNRQNPPKVD